MNSGQHSFASFFLDSQIPIQYIVPSQGNGL
jgi:hypothetical protein